LLSVHLVWYNQAVLLLLHKSLIVTCILAIATLTRFQLSGAVVEQVESYKYLGFVVHATKELTFGTDPLLATEERL